MSRFKVGDRVRSLTEGDEKMPPGTVVRILDAYVCEIAWDEDTNYTLYADFNSLILLHEPNNILKEII